MKHDFGWLRNPLGWNGRGSGGGGVSLPQSSNIVFRHDIYDESDTPQTGAYTYTRSGTLGVPTLTGVTKYAANELPYGGIENGSETMKGVWLGGAITNYCIHSEDFTSWTAIGTGGTSANSATAPDGTTTADSITGSATGDGVKLVSARTANSDYAFVFSVWLKASTSTVNAKIRVTDAGGSDGNEVIAPLTTTWKRYQVPYVFTNGIDTAVEVQIIVDASSTVRAWGAQLEDFNSTSTGRRFRYAYANAYVPTSGSAATAGTSTYTVDNALITGIATKGAISVWMLHEWDSIDITTNHGYAVSIDEEKLAFYPRALEGLMIRFNDAANNLNASVTNAVRAMSPDQWSHYLVTWDADANESEIYRNGILQDSSTSAMSDLVISTNDLHFGRNSGFTLSYVGVDAMMSGLTVWGGAHLTASEALEVYNDKAADAIRSDPGTGKIFSVALGTSPVPTVGDTSYYPSSRAFGPYYHSTDTTTIEAYTPIEYPASSKIFHGSSASGAHFTSKSTNHCLQSEDFATTWTKINSAETITGNSVAAPDGNTTADTIDGTAAGHGVEQTIALASGTSEKVFSVYAKASDNSSRTAVIRVEDTGDTEGTEVTINLTTSWQRFSVYHEFSSGTGNTDVQIIVGDTTGYSAYFWGAQLEDVNNGVDTIYRKIGSDYIPTTTAAVSRGNKPINYRLLDSINYQQGTIIAWAALDLANPGDFVQGNGPALFAAPGQYLNFYFHHEVNEALQIGYIDLSYTAIANRLETTFDKDQWHQYAVSWDQTGGTPVYKMYKDGELLQTTNTATTGYMWHRRALVGGDLVYAAHDCWQGVYDKLDIYGSAQADSVISADYDANFDDYKYWRLGYPAYREVVESGVLAQWVFDEASGNIVDEVNGTTLTITGTPNYETAATGAWSGVSPGIEIDTASEGFLKNSADSNLDIGTNDFTIEWVCQSSDESTNNYIIDTGSVNGATGLSISQNHSAESIVFNFKTAEGTTVTKTFTSVPEVSDGAIHKYRITADRDDVATLYVDGDSKGTPQDISGADGENINNSITTIFNYEDLASSTTYLGTIYELRISTGLTNNSGGPGGG